MRLFDKLLPENVTVLANDVICDVAAKEWLGCLIKIESCHEEWMIQ